MARSLNAETTQKVSRWIHVFTIIAVYILGNFAFMIGAAAGTPSDVWFEKELGLVIAILIRDMFGIPIGVPSLLVYGVITVVLNARAATRLSPLQRVLASAILALLVVFIAGFLWW